METDTKKKEATKLSWKAILKGIEIKGNLDSENCYKTAYIIFLKLNYQLPSILAVGYGTTRVDIDKAYIKIKEVFKLSDAQMNSNNLYDIGSMTSEKNQGLLLIKENLIISFDFMFHYSFSIFYCDDTDMSLIEKIKVILKDCKRVIEPNFTHILAKDNAGKLSLRGFKTEVFTDDVIISNYNEDFLPVNEIILNRLQETNGKGIVLLHGMPGTGKTSYIRYLISKLRKRVIYFPTDLVHIIGTPDFIRFISDFPDSVFIIEDGEELIEQRNGGGSTTISNLLNITDGILGDCLHIQIVCTFNAELAKIDKALLRKGRLIARYKFAELEEKKCEQILKKLKVDEPVTRRMTLAELYNMSEPDFGAVEHKVVGFTNSTN